MTPTELTDDIYTEALAELRHDDAFLAALDAGEMDDAAQASIQSAMVRVLESRERMKAHYLEDSGLRDSLPEEERAAFDAERHIHRQTIIDHYAEHGTYPEICGVERNQ